MNGSVGKSGWTIINYQLASENLHLSRLVLHTSDICISSQDIPSKCGNVVWRLSYSRRLHGTEEGIMTKGKKGDSSFLHGLLTSENSSFFNVLL